ncbi:hypothetical protein TCAL_10600 [Tigriopus californicus]|uniref:Uncharacterized protein n=1 Tax=Tigriopus californicus TaxID=6832 RepID=A0A553P392_TIGCA|nr:hypothetical protein TCAL_10600 [Tigriopus californicus]
MGDCGAGHDDRGQSGYHQPPSHNRVWRKNDKRVSFQDRGGGGGIHKRHGGHKPSRNVFNSLSTLTEGDEDMSHAGTSRRGGYSTRGGYQRGRARVVGAGGPGIRKGRGRGKPGYINHSAIVRAAGGTLPQARGWHRVTIRKGPLYPKNELLSMLVAKCPVPFAPISFIKEGNANCFYVENKEMATALTGLYEKIIMSDGSKLGIMARPSPPPKASHPDGEMLDKLKAVMSSRFLPETKALNLRKFYADPQFLGEPFYAPLNRSLIMNHIIKIIGEHIPGIEAIDLSENDLRSLDDLEKLVEKAPNVKILHLSKNNISNVKDFIMIKDWKLLDLKVDNNPLIDKLTDYIGYVT